jgi:hypothetical protein
MSPEAPLPQRVAAARRAAGRTGRSGDRCHPRCLGAALRLVGVHKFGGPLKCTTVGLSLRSSRIRSSGSTAQRVTNSNLSRCPLRSSSSWIARASRPRASSVVPSGLAARNKMMCLLKRQPPPCLRWTLSDQATDRTILRHHHNFGAGECEAKCGRSSGKEINNFKILSAKGGGMFRAYCGYTICSSDRIRCGRCGATAPGILAALAVTAVVTFTAIADHVVAGGVGRVQPTAASTASRAARMRERYANAAAPRRWLSPSAPAGRRTRGHRDPCPG